MGISAQGNGHAAHRFVDSQVTGDRKTADVWKSQPGRPGGLALVHTDCLTVVYQRVLSNEQERCVP
jgi:hypothetical protein